MPNTGVNRPGWTRLIDLRPQPESPKGGGRARAPAPLLIRFPDGTEVRPSYKRGAGRLPGWEYVLREVVGWLSSEGHLRPEHCPIARPNFRSNYIVHTHYIHADDKWFTNMRKVGQFYVEGKQGSAKIVESARIVIQRVAPHLLNDFWVRPQ